jgi:hypothetical protein
MICPRTSSPTESASVRFQPCHSPAKVAQRGPGERDLAQLGLWSCQAHRHWSAGSGAICRALVSVTALALCFKSVCSASSSSSSLSASSSPSPSALLRSLRERKTRPHKFSSETRVGQSGVGPGDSGAFLAAPGCSWKAPASPGPHQTQAENDHLWTYPNGFVTAGFQVKRAQTQYSLGR